MSKAQQFGKRHNVEHLNYCRQLVRQFKELAAQPSTHPEQRATFDHVVDLCRASQKFLLPENGVLLMDAELRALDDAEPLRLPHPFIALEFQARLTQENGQPVFARRIVFCREDEDGIYVRPAACVGVNGEWIVKRDTVIPKVNYLDRSNPKRLEVVAAWPDGESQGHSQHVQMVLGFLNALQCSNIKIERSAPKHTGKKAKTALPFDAYHVLTIDLPRRPGESDAASSGIAHRSPREHLRRGHIVRPEGRRPYWRNATVVNASRGMAKIEKDYRLRSTVAGI